MSQQEFQNKAAEVNWLKVDQYLKQEIPVLSDESI